MNETIQDKIREWTSAPYDEGTIAEIKSLAAANNEAELTDRFYRDLEFGTGGLRGVLGAGSNRMNIYNVRKVTQGLANYILRNNGASMGVVIGRDSRHQSDRFAEAAAGVFLANGIKVYYYDDIHPTPTVSFAIRHLSAICGIMITASHNPKEYNGYKVFWDDGAQVTPPHDTAIIDEVKNVSALSMVKAMPFDHVKSSPLFKIIDSEVDPVFYAKTKSLSIHPEAIPAAPVKICYSPLYGTGYKMVPAALKEFGFRDILMVEEQSVPNGDFPTTPKPNPEEISAMQMGIDCAKKNNADVFIATDPDADRIGAVLRKKDGSYLLLNGNQIATLLVYYITSELKNTGKMPPNPRMVSTIVTTDLIFAIAESNGVKTYSTLTGFKWIGLITRGFAKTGETFIFGCEESHGYNAADFVRDKDAVNAACLFAEMTAYYGSKGLSVAEVLDNIYTEYGYYRESQVSITMKGMDGAEQINNLMRRLRAETPEKVGTYDVLTVTDVQNSTLLDLKTNASSPIELPKSNVILLHLSDKAKVVARPSGTEPKIKFYFTTYGKSESDSLADVKARTDTAHETLKKEFLASLGLREG
ncbi:MAG: phospho-sugar mutase [Brevinematales bacterium]|nr:phospho-sugar mutase [Brevinematales bacterium]